MQIKEFMQTQSITKYSVAFVNLVNMNEPVLASCQVNQLIMQARETDSGKVTFYSIDPYLYLLIPDHNNINHDFILVQ